MRQKRPDLVAHQRCDVWDLLLDVATVGSAEPRDRDAPVQDPDLAPLPDQSLDQRDHRALPEVVGGVLEGQADDTHPPSSRGQHGLHAPANLHHVGRQDRLQQRKRDFGGPGGMEQRPEVLGQAGAAEREARPEVRLRHVELPVHQEDPHDLVDVGPERRARVTDLVGEAHLERVEGVGDVLGHLRRPDRRVDEGGLDALVEQAQE